MGASAQYVTEANAVGSFVFDTVSNLAGLKLDEGVVSRFVLKICDDLYSCFFLAVGNKPPGNVSKIC